MVVVAVAFIFGAMIGSFLNVCIYRLPRGMSLLRPGSHCTVCNVPIRAFDNLPILSYLILGGQCRACGAAFSARYAWIEALTGGLLALFAWRLIALAPPGGEAKFFVFSTMACALLVATIVDIDRQIIPDEVSLGGAVAAPILSLIFPAIHGSGDEFVRFIGGPVGLGSSGPAYGLTASLIGLLVGAGAVFLAGVLGKWLFKKEAMGLGDVKLMAMVGGFLGWKLVLLNLFLACVLGSVIGILLYLKTRRSRIPFGPHLSVGAILLMVFPQEIVGGFRQLTVWLQGSFGG